MREEDVLISEYRVTVLGDSGQYAFDWVDEESRTVKFLESQSDFSSYDEEVQQALAQKGITIDSDGDDRTQATSSDTDTDDNSDLISPTEPEPIDPDTSTVQNVDKTSKEPDNEQESQNLEGDSTDSFSPVEGDSSSTSESQNKDDSSSSQVGSSETVSFIVRMSDPSERKKALSMLEKMGYENSRDKLELSGPFKVVYEANGDGVELVEVEDMGIGSSVKNN